MTNHEAVMAQMPGPLADLSEDEVGALLDSLASIAAHNDTNLDAVCSKGYQDFAGMPCPE